LIPGGEGCPACDSTQLSIVLELRDVPTQDGVLWPTAADALASPLGDIRLALCERCSYLWNIEHDPELVSFARYDVSLQHSPSFQRFVGELCRRLVERHDLRGRTILEIGCGRGHFLDEICSSGGNVGIGYDPSHVAPEGVVLENERWHIVPEIYTPQQMRSDVDFVACRHVLDIIADQRGLLELVGRTLEHRPNGVAYFEIPDARHTLENHVYWNLVYEHRTWFVPDSARTLFDAAGLEVTDVSRCWHDEYLGIEAKPSAGSSPSRPVAPTENGLSAALAAFGQNLESARAAWTDRANGLVSEGRRVAIWGAGARAIGFLALVPAAVSAVAVAVDINPMRQGLYLPRTAIPVVPPTRLLEDPVDLVLISNSTYADEIVKQARSMGVRCPIEAL
jgi:SAM-dependent methyltransferase